LNANTPAFLALLWPRLRAQRNRWTRAPKADRFTYALLGLFGLTFWAGIFAFLIWIVDAFHEVEIFGPIIARTLLELMVLGLFPLVGFSGVVTALSTFYLSDDLDLVHSLPVSRPSFFFARFIDQIIQSSWMLIFFGLPMVVAYGNAYEAGLRWYATILIVLPGFLLFPSSLALCIASVLVRFFPARKIREAMVLVGVVVVVFLFMMLRLIRPERLVDAESFESVAAYVAGMQAPLPRFTPMRWTSDLLIASLMDKPFPWIELGLLLSGGVVMMAVARHLTDTVYDEGRARSQEARTARLAKSGWLDRVLQVWTAPLPPIIRPMVVKDVKVFIRDPAQWSQLFLVASIVAIALTSVAYLPRDVFRGAYAVFWSNFIAYASHAMVGFIMAAIATRFQFPAISLESRAFWFIRTAPIRPEQLLWAKVWPALPLIVMLGLGIAVPSMLLLKAGTFQLFVAVGNAFGLGFGLSGIAVGVGATWPDFKADSAQRVAASPTALLFMAYALSLVAVVMLLEAAPIYLVLKADYKERALLTWEWFAVVLPLLAAVGACVFATIWPIKKGARALWAYELPNS
jgi:ABC-2 type transport system permease protein